MKILSRYIAREFIKIFLICFTAVATIYLLAHFLGKLDKFIQYKASLPLIGTLILLRFPRIFYEVLPVAVLLATLITLGLFSRNNEITALRSSGIGLFRILLPIFSVVMLLVLVSLADGEWGVPYANQRTHYLNDVALKKRAPILALKKNRIWFRTDENTFCNILKVDPEQHLLDSVSLYTFDDDFNLVARKNADHISWDGKKWITQGGTDWRYTDAGAFGGEKPFEGPFPLYIPLEEIIDVEKSPADMGFGELRDYISILKRNGFQTNVYEVDLHAKISYSMISLIMVLIGLPFAMQVNRSGGISASIGLSLGIGFIYWIIFSVGLSIGHAGLLPPPLSAWAINIVFGVTALYWTSKIKIRF
jgi:lipopolysaccharide export system permease protein